MVRHIVDWDNPPKLSEERKAGLEVLANRPDSKIDYSDIPPLTEKFWQNGVRNPYLNPPATVATVRLDSDILDWFRKQGSDYQTRINAILRREMLNAVGPKAAK